jgi:hypothetical protein
VYGKVNEFSPFSVEIRSVIFSPARHKSPRCLHLDSDAVERLSRSVQNTSGWLRCHVYDQTSLTIPSLNRLYDIPVWRQLRTVWRKIMNRTLNLIEHKNGRPPMMVDGFFVVWLQSYVKHTKPLVLEEDFVVLWRSDHSVQRRVPSRWICHKLSFLQQSQAIKDE